MDEDLEEMQREELITEIKKLRAGVREHRDSTGHELCWHHPGLWGLLPEKTDPLPVVPEWPQFMRGCVRYRESLDQQAPHAPRTREPFRESYLAGGRAGMRLQSFYPIIVTPRGRECREFYQRWFGLQVVFEASWFVLLGTGDGAGTVAFMTPDHPSAPPGPEPFSGKGMCLEFQVADAKAEHDRFVEGGAPLILSLRDEPFGQCRFGLFDPAGVWIDVVEQIEPEAGWWDRYLVGV